MAIPATQMNLPLTTLNIADDTNTAILDGTHLLIANNADATLNASLTTATLQLQNGANQSILSADGGVDLVDATMGYHTELKQTQLKSGQPTFDISFNALTLGGIASTENQVITANVDGKPYWADLPAAVTPDLAQVLAVAGATYDAGDAQNQPITNLSRLGFNSNGATAGLTGNIYGYVVFQNSADVSGDTKVFSRAYLPIGVGQGPDEKVYYLPLFEVPV